MNPKEDDTIKCDCGHWDSESRTTLFEIDNQIDNATMIQLCSSCALTAKMKLDSFKN